MHHRHETIQNLKHLNVACRFLDFCNYGFAIIVRDLTGLLAGRFPYVFIINLSRSDIHEEIPDSLF
ncbi:hypothetical protein ALC56_13047 [Trachymyrmex septentrionalis]|uniref:Uncharacterized protein n=1 Tax=Trachymyrmex septentrionalis TaxID=34720 RepID=A0A195EWP0_9HYME|nr:hypothetical protein ALC56_13047 [Trachymyrmex septentrionalis]